MINAELQPAYILHHYAYRDTSLLLEILTPDHGRLGLIARGVRTPKSRLRGVLQPFQAILCSWTMKGELGSLKQAELAGAAAELKGQALFAAYYVNELVIRLTRRQDPHPDIFRAYVTALAGLSQSEIEPALRLFEKRLLDGLGYGLVLDYDVEGNPVQQTANYRYIPETGPALLSGNERHDVIVTGAALLDLHAETVTAMSDLLSMKRLMRGALALYLGERPLKTRQFLLDVAAEHRKGT